MLILPLLIFSVILGTIQSITDHSINPRHDSLTNQLQEFNKEVTIEAETANEAETQFRGLVTWNMLAAQQCLYPALFYHEESIVDELDNDDYDEDLEDIILTQTSITNLEDLGGNEFSYWGNEDIIKNLVEENPEFSGNCMGADPIKIPGLRDLLPSISWGDTGISDWEGQSAQGKFGQISFKIEQGFVIDEHRLAAMNFEPAHNSWGLGEKSPDFPRGDRAAIFYPGSVTASTDDLICSGVTCTEENSESYSVMLPHLGEDIDGTLASFDDGIMFYAGAMNQFAEVPDIDGYNNEEYMTMSLNAFRVRMKNVPHLASPTWSKSTFSNGDGWGDDRSFFRGQHRWQVGRTHYAMCEGFEGFIMTNVGTIDETGKKYASEDAIYRDLAFPKIVITNTDEIDIDECLDDLGAGGIEDQISLKSDAKYDWIENDLIIPESYGY